MQDRAVDLLHGTGVDGNSHLCIQGHHPRRVLSLGTHTLNYLSYTLNCINAEYFSPLQVKNKPHEGTMNVRLF
jgi:hypothetical protein